MPTERKVFRDDIHLGHKVPTVDTDDLVNGCVTEPKLDDDAVSTRTIQDKAVTEPKLDDNAISTRTIQDKAVTTPKIKDKAVTPEKLSDRIVPEVIEPLLKPLREKDADLQNQIDSITIHGMAVSNMFGNDPHIGVSQKTLTEAVNNIWKKLEEITGETFLGFTWEVSPLYFISETEETIHIEVSPTDTDGIIEHLVLYVNNEPVVSADNVSSFAYDLSLSDTAIIKCEAQVLGVIYERQEAVTHYNSFFLGAGTSYTDIINIGHVIPITNGMRGAYDVTCNEGDNIFVVVGESLADGFIRADMNGIEIEFTKSSVTYEGRNYKVFTSRNTYSQGTYNIDING